MLGNLKALLSGGPLCGLLLQPIDEPLSALQACEMFILELTLRSWNHSEENKRRTLQRNDIAAAITRTDIFDFLVSTSAVLPSPKGQTCDAVQNRTLGWCWLVRCTVVIVQTERLDCLVNTSRTAVHPCC